MGQKGCLNETYLAFMIHHQHCVCVQACSHVRGGEQTQLFAEVGRTFSQESETAGASTHLTDTGHNKHTNTNEPSNIKMPDHVSIKNTISQIVALKKYFHYSEPIQIFHNFPCWTS